MARKSSSRKSAKKSAKKSAAKSAAKSAKKASANVAKKAVAMPTPAVAATPTPTPTLTDSGGATTIVYVHGIANKPPASVLKAQWDHALFEFDLGERSRMAYWVDRERYPKPLDDVVAAGDFADASEEAPTGEFSPRTVRAAWNPTLESSLMSEQIAEIVGGANAPGATQQSARLRSIANRMMTDGALVNDTTYAAAVTDIQGPNGAAVRRIQAQHYGASAVKAKVLGALPRPLRQWLTRRVTGMFLRDVYDLFADQARGEAMRETLRERLRAKGEPFILIAHSQGTVIAYSVLMEPEFASLRINMFVTLGSPLGILEVQDFLRELPHCQTLTVPPNVARWINVADPLDPVALTKDISPSFAKNAKGVGIEHHTKFNPDSPRHPHSATGYLALEAVRQPVRECVDSALFQPVARFKMAKDVVRAYADAEAGERHRILLQLDEYATSALTRDDSLKKIYSALGAAEPDSEARRKLEAEELHRYVALSLTRAEAETLSAIAHSDKSMPVGRIWKNSAKWGYLDRSIHTTQAFPAHNSYRASGADVTWAVLDSGIHWSHPHFANGTIDRVYDCTSAAARRSGAPLEPLDPKNPAHVTAAADLFGHGAHVAGIIAGTHTVLDKTGKQRVLSGMAPDAKLVIYKTLDNNGTGEDSWIIKAIDHIFETNERAGKVVIHGVNLSLGGEFDVEAFNCGHTPLCEELRRLWRQGVVVVLAAGNEGFASLHTADGDDIQANMGMSIGDPANLEDAIVVGSVHKDSPHTYGLSYFSSRGPTADGRMKPDCVAPGERIFSVRPDASVHAVTNPNATFEQLYTEMSGTSMAAPHVSGLVASFLSKRMEFIGEPDRVKRILLDNCTDLGRQRNMQGAGMPNLVKMLVNV